MSFIPISENAESYSNKKQFVFLFSYRYNKMASLLFMRTVLFITILTACCTASISIRVVDDEDLVVIKNEIFGGEEKHRCSPSSKRAVIIGRKLKCVPESEIISTVKATNKIQQTDSKCCFICQILQENSNKVFRSDLLVQSIFIIEFIFMKVSSFLYHCFLLVILLPHSQFRDTVTVISLFRC